MAILVHYWSKFGYKFIVMQHSSNGLLTCIHLMYAYSFR